MAPAKKSIDHDMLIRLEQKLDGLDAKLSDYVGRANPALDAVPKLQENVKWVTKMVIGAYATVLTAAAGAVAAFMSR